MNRASELSNRLESRSLRGIIFDFDGTLLDIREILEKSIEEVLEDQNINVDMEITIQEIGALLETIQGFPLPKILLESYEIFKHITSLSNLSYFKQLRIAVKIFSKYLNYSKDAPLLPGVKELLKKISKSFDLFIVSHNKTETIMEHLENEDIAKFFKGVYGSDKIPVQKPDPLALQPPLETYERRKRDEFLMIGDMPSDIIAGRDAGLWTIGVASGVSKKEILLEYQPDLLIESLEDLLNIM
ncbi:MAG: HAD family hydrolase [Candidatus Lokiarchaeota archaeon]|nr:HAD family hydrolase [Candidatus Lokiarchaeota archaeon]